MNEINCQFKGSCDNKEKDIKKDASICLDCPWNDYLKTTVENCKN